MTELFVIGGFMFFVLVAFVAGMLFLPELFGISQKNPDEHDEKK